MPRQASRAVPARAREALPTRLGVALMPAGALAVHELRYRLAFGSTADAELARQGHAYLQTLGPVAVVLAALALGWTVRRFAATWTSAADPSVRLRRTWALTSVALVAIYAGQELAEGALAAGHPTGLAGVFGSGGWIAVPVAMVIGGALALLLRGTGALRRLGRALLAHPAPTETVATPVRPHAHVARRPVSVLARNLAGRAPPLGIA